MSGPVAHRVGLGGGDLGHQVDAVGAGLVEGGLLEGDLVGRPEGAGHGPRLPDVAGEAAGVDAGDPGHARRLEPRVEVEARPPVGRAVGDVAHDHAPAVGPPALGVLRRHPVVADVGVGEGDDLPRVGRVGEHLLVAAEDGVEHDLPGGHPAGGVGPDRPPPRTSSRRPGRAAPPAAAAAPRTGDDPGVRAPAASPVAPAGRHRWASPSTTTGSPRRTVWRARPVSLRPA